MAVRRTVAGGATPAAADGQYDSLAGRLSAAAEAHSEAAAAALPVHADDRAISAALAALHDCQDLAEVMDDEESTLRATLVGALDQRPGAVAELAADMALFNEDGGDLARSTVPAIAAAWRAFTSDPAVRAEQVVLEQARLGGRLQLPSAVGAVIPALPVDPARLAGAVRGGVAKWVELRRVLGVVSDQLRQAAARTAAGASDELHRWIALVLLAVIGAATVAYAVGRSISRPLARTAEAARAVVEGRLDVEPLDGRRGPREARVVARAFDALVANLRLLEAKAQALAASDFDDPALALPLPGHLGRSLQDTVAVLSGSVQERHELQERLTYQATHDPLTGLLNRAAAMAALDTALGRPQHPRSLTVLVYLDLDRFKRANDLHGHGCGDDVLRTAAARLRGAARTGDSVARLGGDEFVVVAEAVVDTAEAAALSSRLLDALCGPTLAGGHRIDISACAGVAIAGGGAVDGPTSSTELLARADLALYQAKRAGGGRVELFDAALHAQVTGRDSLERDLADELDAGGPGLSLVYQPVVDADGGALRAVEALLRWRRADGSAVGPADFVPVAERSDLIVRLDRWVLDAAARQVRAWAGAPVDTGLAGLPVSVNVSGRHLLGAQLPEHVAEAVGRHGIDPGRLTVEITETVLLDDLAVASGELGRLRGLGVRVAIDDFGTGYTSLAHLHHLPVDVLKVDRTFVTDLASPRDRSLVRMIADLGHHLDATIVTEGVETAEQLATLQGLGCDQVQGFLIARPMPPGDLPGWVAGRRTPAGQVA